MINFIVKGGWALHITNQQASKWFSQGFIFEVNGYKHFVYDSKTDKPALLILHGFPTSSFDYHKALPMLEQYFRVVAHDHLGFGFSDKPKDYSYSLIEQTDQALLVWQALGIKRGVVLAHDYGTSIATELLARQSRFTDISLEMDAMVLCNGSVHIEMAKLRLIQKLLANRIVGPTVARLSSKKTFSRNLRNIYFDASQLKESEIDAMWEMMQYNKGRQVLSRVAQYPKERFQFWHRWIGALRETTLSIRVVWATNDPIAVETIGTTIADEVSNSEYVELENLGHFPMLENPDLWAEAVVRVMKHVYV